MSRVFDKFYFKPKQTILSIDSLINASRSHDENIAPFINNMFCPECLQAQLTFCHETSKHKAYLKEFHHRAMLLIVHTIINMPLISVLKIYYQFIFQSS